MVQQEPLQQHLDALLHLAQTYPEYVLTDADYRFEDCNELYVCRDETGQLIGYYPVERCENHISNLGIIRARGGSLLINDLPPLAEQLFDSGASHINVATLENSKGHRLANLMRKRYDFEEYDRRFINKGVVIYFRVRRKQGLGKGVIGTLRWLKRGARRVKSVLLEVVGLERKELPG